MFRAFLNVSSPAQLLNILNTAAPLPHVIRSKTLSIPSGVRADVDNGRLGVWSYSKAGCCTPTTKKCSRRQSGSSYNGRIWALNGREHCRWSTTTLPSRWRSIRSTWRNLGPTRRSPTGRAWPGFRTTGAPSRVPSSFWPTLSFSCSCGCRRKSISPCYESDVNNIVSIRLQRYKEGEIGAILR